MTRIVRSIAVAAIVVAAAACSDDSSTSLQTGAAATVAVSGNSQQGQPGTTLPSYLVVTVKDAAGRPVPGVQVTWAVTAGDGALASSTSVTDVYGRAIAAWTLGSSAGTQTVTATVQGIAAPVVFTAEANGQVGIPH